MASRRNRATKAVPLSATFAEDREAILQDLLEFLDGAALEEHVPVRAHGLVVRGVRLLAVDQEGLLAGLRDPGGRDLGLGREGHEDPLAVLAPVLDPLPRSGLDAGFRLHGLRSEAHAAQAAIAHDCLLLTVAPVRRKPLPLFFPEDPRAVSPTHPVPLPPGGGREAV